MIALSFFYGYTRNSRGDYLGFPFDWLVFYPNKGYGFLGVGFILNIVIFFLIVKALSKLGRKWFTNV